MIYSTAMPIVSATPAPTAPLIAGGICFLAIAATSLGAPVISSRTLQILFVFLIILFTVDFPNIVPKMKAVLRLKPFKNHCGDQIFIHNLRYIYYTKKAVFETVLDVFNLYIR